ncbi:MAG: saccharopine dehydrogenase NADP-binding domain-containing protein [Thermoplasmata archaeon]|nr:saccharopine dehydrogenase NADP-binding domain-containing protein [Thermoplasmata archaeon]
MDAVVLGGGGLTGRCAVWDLAESGVFDGIRVADLDRGLADTAARKAPGSTHVTSHTVDVRDRAALVDLLRGARVCVNAVQYNFNLDVMEGCLAAGVEYLDFGGLFHMTKRQLALHDRFLAAGLLAVPGMGQVPGISNILAAAATDDLVTVDSIMIRDGWRDFTCGAPPVVFTWSPSTFLDEMVLPAMVWEDGAYREMPAMSGGEEYEFPEPIGRTRLYRTLHSEPATFPDSFRSKGLRHCEWREGGPGIDVLQLLAALGLGSDRPVEVRGHAVAPKEVLLALLKREQLLGYPEGVQVEDREIVDVEVQGRDRSGPVTRHAYAAFRSKPEWGVAATEIAVGVCGSIAAILIAQGKALGKGVVPPELSMPPGPFREMLAARGVVTRICPPEPPLRLTDITSTQRD